VTACPKCMIHLKCAQSGDDASVPDLEIRDLAAVVAGALTNGEPDLQAESTRGGES